MNCTLVAHVRRLLSDHLTPVLAYRRLVAPDPRLAPSFLFESVEQGGNVGRFSLIGARPAVEVIARGAHATIRDSRTGTVRELDCADPLELPRTISPPCVVEADGALPPTFTGGWVGMAAFDAVRWLEPSHLSFVRAPRDDRALPDMHFGLYREVAIFDHVERTITLVSTADPAEHGGSADKAREHARTQVDAMVRALAAPSVSLAHGGVDLDTSQRPAAPTSSTFSREGFLAAVARVRDYIAAGDAFQVVLSQRFERITKADPFDLYRALRVVNPSPYQIYLQAEGCILVAASPEILCRVRGREVTNRPLAGTRPRGRDAESDLRMERELLADEKERAEHVMLVDLGRNDLGRVCATGSVTLDRCMEIERYSHVMHISSTLTGQLRDGLDCWDALRSTLPVGTVSGAPKVRAIEIIDELEPVRRGPYGGGIGAVTFGGDMDIALALRTMVIPTAAQTSGAQPGPRTWRVDIQSGAGVVLDSVPEREFEETVAKAAALGRAIELAEQALTPRS